jgi:hypothetical protein
MLIGIIDEVSTKQAKSRTTFIEESVREKLNQLKVKIPVKHKEPIHYNSVDDIPFEE